MRHPLLSAVLCSLALGALLPGPAPAAAGKPAAKPIAAVAPGLETIIQDDGLLLFRPPAEVQAGVARMKALGIDRVRITANWSTLTRAPESDVEPEGFDAADPGAYEPARWQQLDTAVRAVRAAGMRVVIDIGFWAPHWATSDSPGPRARTNVDPRAYAEFAVAVALRYSGGFTPRPDRGEAPPPAQDEGVLQTLLQPIMPSAPPELIPPAGARAAQAPAPAAVDRLPAVDQFILWNEPNHPGLMLPQWKDDRRTPASPGVYRAMVRAAYPAVKGVRRNVKVLIGNTSSTGGTRGAGAVAPLEFLRELACVDARLRPRTTEECQSFTALPGDGWSHHPYAQNERPSRVSDSRSERGDVRLADLPVLARTLDALVRMRRLAAPNRNIHLTEFGYETGGIPGRPRVTELMQARWLTWAEYIADGVPSVRSFAQFLLRDQPPAPVRVSNSKARPFGQYSTGLLRTDGTEKIAARTFVAGLFAQLLPRGRVLLYARLRLGAGRRTVMLEQRRPRDRWRLLERLRVRGHSALRRTPGHRPGTLYRLSYAGADGRRSAGIAIEPVPLAR